MMKQRTRLKRSISGFTLIEMLVIVIIIGVLFAIAAPGWSTFLSRQRVSSAREQVTQAIRVAQSEAKRTRAPRVVVFDDNSGRPRFVTAPFATTATLPINNATLTNWVALGNNSINANTIQLATNQGLTRVTSTTRAIVFDANGAVAQTPNQSLPFVITVARGGATNRASDRCVVVDTILGAVRSEEGAFISATEKGCRP